MLHETSLQGMTTVQLEQLRHTVLMDFFAPETTDADRDTLTVFDDKLKACLPHTFVLASLFDVEAMTNEVPEHVYESDPSLEWVTCPCCEGKKWIDTGSSPWTGALFADPRMAYAYRHLNHSYKVCGRCLGSGEVLDSPTYEKYELYEKCAYPVSSIPVPFDEQGVFDELGCSLNKVQTESAKSDLMNTIVTYKRSPLPVLALAA